jgi:hypothetical protein
MVPKKQPNAVAVACDNKYGSFSVLATNDSSDPEEEHQAVIRPGVPKPVAKRQPTLTGPSPVVEPPKPFTWAQRVAATTTTTTQKSATSLTDTRFQLHALCENIGVSKRAPPRMNAATESSKKRKQDMAMVPA